LKTLTLILTIVGIAVFTAITAWQGIGPVLDTVRHIGIGGFALMVAVQIAIDAGLGLAWRMACPDFAFWRLAGARLVRDAAGACLPFSQLGGMALGIRATLGPGNRKNPDGETHWPEAVSANIVDVTTEVLGQVAFIILALFCLVGHHGAHRYVWPVIAGACFLICGITGFIWTQQRGGASVRRIAGFLGNHIAAEWRTALIGNTDEFQRRLDALWARPWQIGLGAVTHLTVWMGSAGMTWLCYRLLGAHLSFTDAIAIEGVECGIMSASFLVPSSLGVQEAGYVGLGMIFGIDPKISLGLSLLRRGRDLVIGVPVLALWQGNEMRRLRHARALPATLHAEPDPDAFESESFEAHGSRRAS
jgi:putative membrane protein